MKLKQVIGGLEEKDIESNLGLYNLNEEISEKQGYNQLCNREVSICEDRLLDIVDRFEWNGKSYKDLAKALSKAISEGKILTLKNGRSKV